MVRRRRLGLFYCPSAEASSRGCPLLNLPHERDHALDGRVFEEEREELPAELLQLRRDDAADLAEKRFRTGIEVPMEGIVR